MNEIQEEVSSFEPGVFEPTRRTLVRFESETATCPPADPPKSITIHCVMTGTLTSGPGCGGSEFDIASDGTICCDLEGLWFLQDHTVDEVTTSFCINDCNATTPFEYECPAPCASDLEDNVFFGVTIGQNQSSGEWVLRPYFTWGPRTICDNTFEITTPDFEFSAASTGTFEITFDEFPDLDGLASITWSVTLSNDNCS